MSNSILTNVGAQAALQNLRSVGNNMGQVQERISTGLKVGNAKDNASAFAVAQTMRSDIASFKAIGEGLSVSESTVSVARQASETVSDLVKTLREKITDAENPAVQNEKIQADIDQTIDQIKTVIGSAQFNGVNLTDGGGTQRILSSVDRAGSNVSGSYIDVTRADLRVDGGALGMLDNMRVADVRGADVNTRAPTGDDVANEITVNLGGLSGANVTDNTTSTVSLFGAEYTVLETDSAEDVLNGLASQISAEDDFTATVSGGQIKVVATPAGDDLAVDGLADNQVTFGDGVTATQNNVTLNSVSTQAGGQATAINLGNLQDGDVLSFNYNGDDYKITIGGTDNTDFSKENGIFQASAATADDVVAAINTIDGGADATNNLFATNENTFGGNLLIHASEGNSINGLQLRSGVGEDFQTLLGKVESALQVATSAAAEFGSIGQRLELQSDFVSKLTGALEAGVGALVDADMAEESARLQALQVQQQLSTQALSIANSQPQNILALFG